MTAYFHTAGIEVALWVPPLVALVVSFFTSMGGVSGAVLLLPFQMSVLQYTAPSVSATNQVFNVVAIPGGVYRYIREGRMVWPLAGVVILGAVPGVLIGAVVRVAYLPDPRNFKLFAAVVLLYIGGRLAAGVIREEGGARKEVGAEWRFSERIGQQRMRHEASEQPPVVVVKSVDVRSVCYEFCGEQFSFSTVGVLVLSVVVGIVGGIYGIGGGAIIAPVMVTLFGLPVHSVAGAALLGTCVTSVAAVGFYQAIAPFYPAVSVSPDWLLGGLFGVGGMVGMYLGARCQKIVPASAIKWLLAGVLILIAAGYLFNSLGEHG